MVNEVLSPLFEIKVILYRKFLQLDETYFYFVISIKVRKLISDWTFNVPLKDEDFKVAKNEAKFLTTLVNSNSTLHHSVVGK